jgi:hypothetical protein
MRRIILLTIGLLLLCPGLAHADALDGALLMLEIMAAVWGVALLGMLFSALAYWKPNSRTLAISSYVVNGMGLLLGLAWELVFNRISSGGPFGVGLNPFLSISVPLAVWLWAANKIAYRSQPQASTWMAALAVAGASSFVNAGLFGLIRWLLPSAYIEVFGTVFWRWLVGPAILFGVWGLVLRQGQRVQPLRWLPRAVWVAPAQALLLGTVWSYLSVLPMLAQLAVDLDWFTQVAGHSLLSYGIGALVIWLNQRRPQPASESPA